MRYGGVAESGWRDGERLDLAAGAVEPRQPRLEVDGVIRETAALGDRKRGVVVRPPPQPIRDGKRVPTQCESGDIERLRHEVFVTHEQKIAGRVRGAGIGLDQPNAVV